MATQGDNPRSGRDEATKYEATFEPEAGSGTARLAVDKGDGAALAADDFARRALRDLPDGDGRITIANLPEDQAEQTPDEEMPENQ